MFHDILCSLVLSIGFALRASFWGCAIGLCRWNLPRGVASGFGLGALPLGVAPGLRPRALSVGSDPGRSSLGSVSGRQGDDVHGRVKVTILHRISSFSFNESTRAK